MCGIIIAGDKCHDITAPLYCHHIFNICYPVGLESVYTFLEYIHMGKKASQANVILIVSFLLCMHKFCTVLLACQAYIIPGICQRNRISIYLYIYIYISIIDTINIII